MKNILLACLICLALTQGAYAEMSQAEVKIKFSQGVEAYKKANYSEAINDFDAIIKGERESAAVYFNLGNSYFKNGKTGLAVLNYERALQLAPRDSDIKFNYQYVLNKTKQLENDANHSLTEKFLSGFIGFYTLGEIIGIILIAFLFSVGIVIFNSLMKYFKVITGIVLSISLGILLIFLTGLFFKLKHERGRAIILADTQAKFEPRKEGTTHFELFEGNDTQIIAEEDQWLKIRRFDGKSGWIEKSSAERVHDSEI